MPAVFYWFNVAVTTDPGWSVTFYLIKLPDFFIFLHHCPYPVYWLAGVSVARSASSSMLRWGECNDSWIKILRTIKLQAAMNGPLQSTCVGHAMFVANWSNGLGGVGKLKFIIFSQSLSGLWGSSHLGFMYHDWLKKPWQKIVRRG